MTHVTTFSILPLGDILALGGKARHAQPEPGGVLGPDEERQRAQVLLRRARRRQAHHAELNQRQRLHNNRIKCPVGTEILRVVWEI